MTTRILICGLPGSGKTTLAKALAKRTGAIHLDGDAVRKAVGYWAFSVAGRLEQSRTMRSLSDTFQEQGHDVIASFVCPLAQTRDIYGADYTVFMDTVVASEYSDTNAMWEEPKYADYVWTEHYDPDLMAQEIQRRTTNMSSTFNWKRQTGLMIGRFQPWHGGHRALFVAGLAKFGQVAILVRDTPRDGENPYGPSQVFAAIHADLKEFRNQYTIMLVPNTIAVFHGRRPGWSVYPFELSPEIEAISATEIRKATCADPS